MLLRLNGLLNPASGVRPLVPERLSMLLNRGIHPVVPEQGSVGASGDLAPLSHLASMLIGQGEVEVVSPPSLSPPHSSLLPPPQGGGSREQGGSRVAAAVAFRDAATPNSTRSPSRVHRLHVVSRRCWTTRRARPRTGVSSRPLARSPQTRYEGWG